MTTNHVTDISEFTFSSREEAEIAYSAYFDEHVARMEDDIANAWVERRVLVGTPTDNGSTFTHLVYTFENNLCVKLLGVTTYKPGKFYGDRDDGTFGPVDAWVVKTRDMRVSGSLATDDGFADTLLRMGYHTGQRYWFNRITSEQSIINPYK